MKPPARENRPAGRPNDLAIGLSHHRAGRLADAAQWYHQMLAVDPRNPDAHHLLGLLALGRGEVAMALESFEQAVALRPANPRYRSNLGHCLRLAGQLDRAAAELERATQHDPNLVEAWINLGLVQLDRGDPEAALALLESAVARAPDSALARLNLGSVLQGAHRLEEARSQYQQAIRLAPELGLAHKNLALVHQLSGRLPDAITSYRRAAAFLPDDADLWTNLGVAHAAVGDLDAALEAQERAVQLAPDLAAAWLNHGTVLEQLGRLALARASFVRALELEPTPAGLTALGSVALALGNRAEALSAHRRSVALDPEFADGHWNLSLALLATGDLAQGWDEYDWRWKASSRPAEFRGYPWPIWRGEVLSGKRLLVWREQGLGDEIMFLTCLTDLVAAGGSIDALVSPRLASLVERACPGARVLPDQPGTELAGEYDYQIPMGSIPRWTRPGLDRFPTRNPLWRPTTQGDEAWKDRLTTLGSTPKIGICWRSGLVTSARRRHYPPWSAWDPLWRIPGVSWINLQYDDCETELAELGDRGVPVARWPEVDLRNDLESVVGLLANLDAVVTAPTAVSSLAGAVGVPTWQIDSGNDWTTFGAARSPWFPSVRLITKQPTESSWSPSLERLAADLTTWLDHRSRGAGR